MNYKDINKRILDLWQKYFTGKDVYCPILYNPFKKNGILFIGLNPSFSDKGFKKILKGTEWESINPREYFKWKGRGNLHVEALLKVEKAAFEKYEYFSKFKKIAKEFGLKPEHIDLFFYKETSQGEFKKRIFKKSDLNEFGKEQLKISLDCIKIIDPKIVLVANALASDILKDKLDSLQFDSDKGYHTFLLGDRRVPIFFCSMLTGQRALDKGSYERLKWHIGKAVSY